MKLKIIKYSSGKIGLEIIGETDFETKTLDAHWDKLKPSRGKGESILDDTYTSKEIVNLVNGRYGAEAFAKKVAERSK